MLVVKIIALFIGCAVRFGALFGGRLSLRLYCTLPVSSDFFWFVLPLKSS